MDPTSLPSTVISELLNVKLIKVRRPCFKFLLYIFLILPQTKYANREGFFLRLVGFDLLPCLQYGSRCCDGMGKALSML